MYCVANLINGKECYILFIAPPPVAAPPTNVAATAELCDNITLPWTQASYPKDITTLISCTPPSPGCAGCTTSPCTITGLSPSTEYEFTVTLNSLQCGASMNTTTARTMGESDCVTSAYVYVTEAHYQYTLADPYICGLLSLMKHCMCVVFITILTCR